MVDIIVRAVPYVTKHISGVIKEFILKTQHAFTLYVICDEDTKELIKEILAPYGMVNRLVFVDATDNISKDFNAVALNAKRDHILFTTGGVLVSQDWSDALVRFCSSYDIAAITPRLISASGDIVNAGVVNPEQGIAGLRGFGQSYIASHYGVAEYCVSVLDDFMFVRRKVFETVGPFQEKFAAYFNEHDWCRRAITEFKLRPYYVSEECVICDGKVSGYGGVEWERDKRIYRGEEVPVEVVNPVAVDVDAMLVTAGKRGKKIKN